VEILTMLKHGGWIMFPIGLCSLAGLAIIIERMVVLRRERILAPSVIDLVEHFSEDTPPETALEICRSARGPFARIVEEIIGARHLPDAQVIETLQATGRTQVSTMERGLTLLEIIGNVSPLLGLLGTVLGMVTVFNAISVEGVGHPRVLSEGISKALITTVAGLIVAIPAVAFHSWLSARVDDMATEMHERATAFVSKLHYVRLRARARQ
jgi:biopolymer transport protein ExbB